MVGVDNNIKKASYSNAAQQLIDSVRSSKDNKRWPDPDYNFRNNSCPDATHDSIKVCRKLKKRQALAMSGAPSPVDNNISSHGSAGHSTEDHDKDFMEIFNEV